MSNLPTNQVPSLSNDAKYRELYELWRAQSENVHRARHTPYPTGTNDLLQQQVKSDPQGLLAPMFLQWMGDNFQLEGCYAEAIQVYQEVAEAYPDRSFGEMPWRAVALDNLAVCAEFLGDISSALEALLTLAEQYSEVMSPAWLHYRIGRLLERAGRDDEAIAAYKQASDLPDAPKQTMVNINDLSRRDAERLARPREWMRNKPEALARELLGALRERNATVLESLASPTHFSLGPMGSERHFVNRKAVLAQLFADLDRSSITARLASLKGAGGKRYFDTQGWQGERFRDDLVFLMTETRDGFEWSGLGVTRMRMDERDGYPDPDEKPHNPGKPSDKPSQPPNQPTVTPADLNMKAPWAAGEFFRAGGIIPMTATLVGIAAALAGTGPFFFLFYSLALLNLSLASPCGLGPGGLYYGQPTTHVDADHFAIDFCRFVRGVPFLVDARGKAVLAVADGVVSFVRSNFATGDETQDNQVIIGHMTSEEIFFAFLIELLTGQRVLPKYSSEYLHLDGPGLIPVSLGMIVRQGARLGLVDDTGLSVSDHLHFSLHDRDLPPASNSVRPTPMDGQTLNDWDDGRCMFSTNIPIP